MKYISIRNIPEILAKAIIEEKQRRNQSLNKTIIDLLFQALGLSAHQLYDNGLGKLAGSWNQQEFEEFEKKRYGKV